MSERKQSVIDYIIACVNDFSDTRRMDCVAAFDYLRDHGGVAFLERNYDVEHAYSMDTAIADVAEVCRNNGGTLYKGKDMTAEVKQLIEFATQDLVAEIVEHENLSISDAMDKLYHSDFFRQLSNPALGLYRESGAYLYAAFQAA